MKQSLEDGDVDQFCELLDQHWACSKMIDEGSTNELIDHIFDSCDDLLAGKMVCGAGGGGFLQAMLKKGISKDDVDKRLNEVFPDSDIHVWDCELI